MADRTQSAPPAPKQTPAIQYGGLSAKPSLGEPLYTMDSVHTVPAIRKKNGEVYTAHGTGFLRRCTMTLISKKMIEPKQPAIIGAMTRPEKIAPMP